MRVPAAACSFALLSLAIACGGSTPSPSPSPEPEPSPVPAPTTDPPGSNSGSGECADPKPSPDAVCMQECGPPVASDNDPPPRSRWFTAEEAKNRQQFGCPICLPSSARIETPRGSVAIGEIVPGMTVVSVDEAGARIAARVTYVGSAEVAASHELVVLELEDGRVVRASEGHPLAGGRTFAKIVAGDAIDGARVRSVTRVPYSGGRTWDLIVDSPTGFYVADGVVLASTLHAHPSAVGTR